jgi:hypothetical protein
VLRREGGGAGAVRRRGIVSILDCNRPPPLVTLP